ncbi:MAG: hypothetical protein GTO45_32480 [Candidatus Aminicenantes bacterium]|nr:hypothetical protein [Candidatus Aminicenantes bacterium]NIM83468.1 hypothetical protein [Candidatus Aminicenantes bacterium]NIN22860.1 hypothetical protein [Candidatus Aminicenantes bacterium]NIN46596.1 hypothetical protein [Candidatus Aminicenantes bacterium]NIN89499.1 hypothetical protein [Candidatus Aminicenantes bacterium]
MINKSINTILSFAAKREVSDIHFQVGVPQLYFVFFPFAACHLFTWR